MTARIISLKMVCIMRWTPGSWWGPCDSGGFDRGAKSVPHDSRVSEDWTVSCGLDHALRAELLWQPQGV